MGSAIVSELVHGPHVDSRSPLAKLKAPRLGATTEGNPGIIRVHRGIPSNTVGVHRAYPGMPRQLALGVRGSPRVTTGYTTHTRYTQSARGYRRGTQPDDAWEAAVSPAERRVLRVHGRAAAEAADHVFLGLEPQPQRRKIVPRRALTCTASHRQRTEDTVVQHARV
jgi:hypothetical protein